MIATPQTTPPQRAPWKATLEPYARPHLGRSALDVLTSVVPYIGLFYAMNWAIDVSYWLVLALAVPASGFLLRTYILFHDCTHGSFLPSKRANTWVGRTLGLVVFSPFASWKHNHAVHHATAGDLDRRGVGDIPTLTVAEYKARDWKGRLAYRAFRHPLVMFGVGPLYALALYPRFIPKKARSRVRNSVLTTNVMLTLGIAGICILISWEDYLFIQLPVAWLAATAGVFLFYVQHQFEDTYWRDGEDWTYADAALRGSSYLKLPKVLQFFTGNIGLHHVHHLSARVPNYFLQRAHDENPIFHDVPVLSLWDGLKATRLKLWDEETGRLVTFAEARG